MTLNPIDLTILLVYLAGMVALGLYLGRRQKTASDFMVGGRDCPWWVILCSIVATETSTITFLAIPGIGWSSDLTFLQLPLGYIIGRLIVVGLLLPRYFSKQMFTAYEVLDQRFGGRVKQVASLLFIITRTLGDGLRLYLGAIVLQKVAGIPLNYAIISLGLATILYTFVGGMRAVLWTDFIQFLVYMLGAGVAFAVILHGIDGGWQSVVELAATDHKLRLFNGSFNLTDNYLLWTGLIGGSVFAIATHGVDQMMVQRYLSARNQRDAGLALGLSGPVVFIQFAFFLVIGTALFAFYAQHPPSTELTINEVFATFIVGNLPVGILGIVLGALFSAAMSTLSSSLNSAATALVNDITMPATRCDVSDKDRLRAAKTLTIVFGLAQIIVGLSGDTLGGSVVDAVLAIQGFTTGIILGVFLLGIFARKVDHLSALTGLIGGLTWMTCIVFGTTLAWPWFVLVGSSVTFLLGVFAQRVNYRSALIGLVGGLALMTALKWGANLAWPWCVLVGAIASFLIGLLVSFILEKE
jgi:SSS family transporter